MNTSTTYRIGCIGAVIAALQLAGCNDRVPEVASQAGAATAQNESPAPVTKPPAPAAAPVPDAPAPQSEQSAADATLSAKVESALKAEPDLHGAAIAVRSEDGVVILTGAARDPQLRSIAAQVALSIDGVKHVRNEITVAQEA
jgi:hyperosmotically inducible protein